MKILYVVAVTLVLLAGCAGDYPVDMDSLPKQQYIYFLTDTFNIKANEMETYYARMNADGTKRKYLTRLWERRETALYSPDRRKVTVDHQVMNIDGTNRKYLAEGNGTEWSPSSSFIVYWKYDSLITINVHTFEKKLVSTEKYIDKAVWAYDSRSLFYKFDSSIISIKADGSNRKVLLKAVPHSEIDDVYNISSSPRSDLLIFSFKNGLTGKYGIGSMKSDGSQLKTLANSEYFSFADWSPDGKKILATEYISNREIISEIEVQTLTRRQLVTYQGKSVYAPNYSPNAQKITFTLSEKRYLHQDDKSRLFIMNSDGSGLRSLTADTIQSNTPSDRFAGWGK